MSEKRYLNFIKSSIKQFDPILVSSKKNITPRKLVFYFRLFPLPSTQKNMPPDSWFLSSVIFLLAFEEKKGFFSNIKALSRV